MREEKATVDEHGQEVVQRLFVKNSAQLRGFILGLLPDLHQTEDVLQEVFLTLNRKANEYRPGSDFLSWARTVARLKTLEHYAKQKGLPHSLSPEVMDVLVIRAPEIDDSWAGSREALSACLKQITARSRELIDLRYGEQLSPAQVAERISWTVEAVKVGLSRVRKMLRECVQRRFSVEGL